MRVTVVTTSYPAFAGDPCGHFVETEARLLARDAEVTVLTAGGEAASLARGDDGVLVWRGGGGGAFGWPGAAARIRERPWRLGPMSAWALRARAFLRTLPPAGRIVAHWSVPGAFPVACGLGADLEIVSHGADVRLLLRLPSPFRTVVMTRLLADASRWRFVSGTLLEALLDVLSADQRRRLSAIACVRAPPIEIPDVARRSRELRAMTGDAELHVCVGRLVAGKRFDRALAHVAAASPRARLVVVGDGPERALLESLSRTLGVDARFVGRTPREEALAWIAAADSVLHASRAEGLSTVVREAAALGVPVRWVD